MEIFKKLESLGFFNWLDKEHNLRDTDMNPEYLDNLSLTDIHRTVANSMVFRWFREKYHIIGYPIFKGGKTTQTAWYDYVIYSEIEWEVDNPNQQWKTYEEAELACLTKLIEIIENNSK